MTNQTRNRSPSQKERIREIAQQLEKGVKAVFESDQYKKYKGTAFCICCVHLPQPSAFGMESLKVSSFHRNSRHFRKTNTVAGASFRKNTVQNPDDDKKNFAGFSADLIS